MLTEPLPTTVDIRRAASRGVRVAGVLKALDLPRLLAMLAGNDGLIQAYLAFSKDEEGRYRIAVSCEACVSVSCQRCLEPLAIELVTINQLVAVWNDEQAKHLPKDIDPLLLTEEDVSLWQVVEDELILAMPSFSYHKQTDCNRILTDLVASEPVPKQRKDKPNPFDVLAQLKPGEKNQE
ncbi:MAG: YceD family protein [Parahaliea sp.]